MNIHNFLSVSRRRSLFIWGLFCAVSGTIFLAYALASRAVGRGDYVMPLDDVYIHFQYARQLAAGQPYVYNPGLPPSSGATSFLYPYILAVGYLIGFQGFNLGIWAMGIGALALVGSMWLVYKLVLLYAYEWLAVAVALIFALSGVVSWHFMSGMETGLVVLFSLGTVYALTNSMQLNRRESENTEKVSKKFQAVVIWATLMALIRPEGAVLTVLAVGAMGWRLRRGLKPPANDKDGKPTKGAMKLSFGRIRQHLKNLPRVIVIPLLAIGVQPVVNLLLTGSAVASGNSAKSVFGMIPFSWGAVIGRIASNFAQMWTEFLTGSSPREGMYIAPLMLVLAVIGIGLLLAKRERRLVGLVIVGWLVGGTLLVATLDTAFWHFKRYQMPFMALLFPVGAISYELLAFSKSRIRNAIVYGVVAVMGVTAIYTAGQFYHYYALNVDYVYLQPLQMAWWLQANTPPDAVVAVHDTGMMRYMGGRTTIDMVGLTTPGAADYWRNGPGSVAEYLMLKRPDYIAAYGPGHGFGLGMIADTSIYGEPLASFPVQLDNGANVALAADFQGIYRPDWRNIHLYWNSSLQPYGDDFLFGWEGKPSIPSDSINVADLANEARSNYHWRNSEDLPGFPTEVHQLDYVNCTIENCNLVDGGRSVNGEESFDILRPCFDPSLICDVILVTRVNPMYAGTFDVYADDVFVGTRWIPAIPGKWLEIYTFIPQAIVNVPTHIRIVPHISGGYYMPYEHMVYHPTFEPKPETAISTFQDGAIVLAKADIAYQAESAQAAIKFEWYTDGSAQGDYKLFVHVYDDVNQPPVVQWDGYPGGGTLPPGDWLPGVLRDTITVDLNNIPIGKYKVAIGLYNPYTNERLQPTGGDAQGRLFIGQIEVK